LNGSDSKGLAAWDLTKGRLVWSSIKSS
jgi:hypothetical protein